MEESSVALTYGEALYGAAREAGREKEILEEADCLASLLETEDTLRRFLANPAVQAEEKKQFMESILQGHISKEMLHFIYILIDKNRTWHMPGIAAYFRKLYDREQGLSEGVIFSAVPLTENQMNTAEEALSNLLQKRVRLRNEVDESLIGGIKIQADGRMLDCSLKGELDRLLAELKG